MNAKDLYIQNITISEHANHSDGFQVKFPKIFIKYMNGRMRVEDKKYIDWENYELNFVVIVLVLLVVYLSNICLLKNE